VVGGRFCNFDPSTFFEAAPCFAFARSFEPEPAGEEREEKSAIKKDRIIGQTKTDTAHQKRTRPINFSDDKTFLFMSNKKL